MRSSSFARKARVPRLHAWVCLALCCCACQGAQLLRVATYNLNNYTDQENGNRPAKTAAGKAKIRESIKALGADVIALQEVGGARAFNELRQSLKADGVDYHWGEIMFGQDTNIQVAILSKHPIIGCRRHTNDNYLLAGKRFSVQRGFLEARIQPVSNDTFTAITTHLKSRRQVAEGDEAEMRLQEAILLRERIDDLLKTNPRENLVVLGDFNDVKDSKPIRALIGRYRNALVDTRPAERNGDTEPASNPRWDPPWIAWTHFYGKEDTYSRIDYILVSPAMASRWRREGTYVLALPNWGVGSDHRPVVAAFALEGGNSTRASNPP